MKYKKLNDLQLGLDKIISSPKQIGIVKMIVSRPKIGIRKIQEMARLDKHLGLIGDNWHDRGSSSMQDKSADVEAQLTIMNSRVITLMTQNRDQWSLAGDQLYIGMDISRNNLPPGSYLKLGSAILKVSAKPHTGCKKFSERFGLDVLSLSVLGKVVIYSLRGINHNPVESGIVHTGDTVIRQIDH